MSEQKPLKFCNAKLDSYVGVFFIACMWRRVFAGVLTLRHRDNQAKS